MNVLVVNAGSSSLKYQLFDTTNGDVIAKGLCERIGIDGKLTHKQLIKGVTYSADIEMPNHTTAMKAVVDALLHAEHGCISSMSEIEAVGHRAVHGGQYFSQSVILTDEVYDILDKKCRDLAPLHTPASLQGIQACLDILPGTPQALVFDTAFHQTMPEEAYMYGVSYDLYEEYGIRRYGMHGTSHRYVAGEMIKLLGGKAEGTKIVTCHLGNGSSISAVKDGKCIDTTMGFTPLAGTIMGTRCGDIDPALVTYIMEKKGYSIDEVNSYLNKKCGFLGISGVSSDCRDLEAAIKEGNHRAKLAIDILIYQIKKYIGSYAAAMGGLDAVVFTAGIGENTGKIRGGALEGLEFLGIELNKELNLATYGSSGVTKLSTDASKVAVYMIPTNEELVIAQDTEALVKAL
ncbi:MAG: acetate kinase [Clostridia bacterium]|nr:acetate kinase [Clostridia bacterium]